MRLLSLVTFVLIMLALLEGGLGRRRGSGRSKVSCGMHSAPACSLCTLGKDGTSHGRSWCNGECQWRRGRCVASVHYGGQQQYSPNFYMLPDSPGSFGVF
eukprot:GFUD01028783.1.p1 GENE.GFUD01028783.1~~GFUD01028783.1.p1  ORF type:complete len:100 (+),score=18.65 GFUD01028783.1:183-482(+)